MHVDILRNTIPDSIKLSTTKSKNGNFIPDLNNTANFPFMYLWNLGHRKYIRVNILDAHFGRKVAFHRG